MKIRTATIEDLDAVTAVEAECFPAAEAATKEEFQDRLIHYGSHFWLMFEDERLIAFVDGMVTDESDLTDEMYEKAQMHDENGAWQMIFGVNTIPAFRNRGCAGQLIQRAIGMPEARDERAWCLPARTDSFPTTRNSASGTKAFPKSPSTAASPGIRCA